LFLSLYPKQYFQDNNFLFDKPIIRKQLLAPAIKPPSEISSELFKSSLKSYEANNFVLFLKNLFGAERAANLLSKYYIGTQNTGLAPQSSGK